MLFFIFLSGLIVGWLNVLGNFFSFLFGVSIVVLLSIYDCDDLREFLTDAGGLDKDELYICSIGRGRKKHFFDWVFNKKKKFTFFSVLIGLGFVFMAFSIGCFIITCYYFKGLNRKNHIHVKPMMILMAALAILSFIDIFSATVSSLPAAIIGTVCYAYEFVVVYSIYKKYEDEFYKAPPAYFSAPTEKV